MKNIVSILVLVLALFAFESNAAKVKLSWPKSTDVNVQGYNVYYGPEAGNYNTKQYTTNDSVVISVASGSTVYFATSQVSKDGLESDLSDETKVAVPAKPSPPSFSSAPVN